MTFSVHLCSFLNFTSWIIYSKCWDYLFEQWDYLLWILRLFTFKNGTIYYIGTICSECWDYLLLTMRLLIILGPFILILRLLTFIIWFSCHLHFVTFYSAKDDINHPCYDLFYYLFWVQDESKGDWLHVSCFYWKMDRKVMCSVTMLGINHGYKN